MQKQLAAEGLPLAVQILGINPAGLESGNALVCAGRDLPWLQESTADSVSAWGAWGIVYRDVLILDPENEKVTAYNLTTHDLADSANFAALAGLIRDAATP